MIAANPRALSPIAGSASPLQACPYGPFHLGVELAIWQTSVEGANRCLHLTMTFCTRLPHCRPERFREMTETPPSHLVGTSQSDLCELQPAISFLTTLA